MDNTLNDYIDKTINKDFINTIYTEIDTYADIKCKKKMKSIIDKLYSITHNPNFKQNNKKLITVKLI